MTTTKTPPVSKSCSGCTALQTVVETLLEEVTKLNKLLMSFHQAGLNLSHHEETMAKYKVEQAQHDADAARSTAKLLAAEASSQVVDETNPNSKFGTKGHKRIRIG